MRNLDECRAEVFRRSEKRIKERKRIRDCVLTLCIPLCLVVALLPVAKLSETAPNSDCPPNVNEGRPAYNTAYNGQDNAGPDTTYRDRSQFGALDSFSFSLTWECNGINSYDSKTGKLIKTTDTTHPADYITTHRLTKEEKQRIYDMLAGLHVTTYPDTYNPHKEGIVSSPSMTLILTVRTNKVRKTVTAKNIALLYESDNPKGQRFLSVCKAIEEILTATEEWKALPEEEFSYD